MAGPSALMAESARPAALTTEPARQAEGRPAGAGRTVTATVVGSSAVLAALVVTRHLGTKPLWRDEAISVSVATRPLLRILSVLPHHDANAGGYYVVLHLWLRLGSSTSWARGLSAVCFTATAALLSWATCRWRGPEVGVACGLLVATNPFLGYYGQEARPYALGACLAVVSTIALFWQRDQPAAAWYVAATVALVYADLFALLFVAAMAGGVALAHRSRRQPVPRVLVRSWAAIAVATAPLAGVMLVGERGQISWLTRPSAHYLIQTVTAMTAGWFGLALMLALGGLAAVALGRTRGRDQLVVVALVAAFAVPPPALWAVAQVVPCFIDRYVICSTVALIGVVGAGLGVLRSRAGPLAAAMALVALVMAGGQRTVTLQGGPYKVDNAPAIIGFIVARARPDDAIGYAGGGLRVLVNASRPGAPTAPHRLRPAAFPLDVALAPGGEELRQHDLYASEVAAPVLARRLAGVQRLWLLTDATDRRYPRGGPFARLRPLVTSEFTPTTLGSFGAVDVTLLVRR